MSMIRGTPDDHLLPGFVPSDEIAALEGHGSLRSGLGGDMPFGNFGRNFPTSGIGATSCPSARAPLREAATSSRTSRGPRATSSATPARTTSFSDP
jgi:hypothetical protein